MGLGRTGEAPIWKVVRLWPVLIAIVAFIGWVYTSSHVLSEVKDAQKTLWERTGDNKDAISVLNGRSDVIDNEMKNINKSMDEQKADTKSILTILRNR